MKKMIVLAAAFAAALMSGCATTSLSSPRLAGNFAGRAVYVTYARVADRQSEDVRSKVEQIWKEVNAVNDASDLNVVRTLIGDRFDAVIDDANLTAQEKQILKGVKDEMLAKVDEAIAGKAASNQEGLEFLLGVRDGVNAMAELSVPVKEQ